MRTMTEREIERLVQDELVPACIGRFRRLRKLYPNKRLENLGGRAQLDTIKKFASRFDECGIDQKKKASLMFSDLSRLALNEEIDGPIVEVNVTGAEAKEYVA